MGTKAPLDRKKSKKTDIQTAPTSHSPPPPLEVLGTRMLHAASLFRVVAVVSSSHARTLRRRPTPSSRWALFATMSSSQNEDDASLALRKKATRSTVKAALRGLTPEAMSAESAAIARHLLSSLSCFDESRAKPTDRPTRLGLYVHCAKLREVDTKTLLEAALALPNTEVYVPIVDMPNTPNTAPSMRFLEVTDLSTDLEPKTMGILEPTEFLSDGKTLRPDLETRHETDGPLDILLMPGLVFEPTGERLGRGGGFYDAWIDRYFRKCDEKGWAKPPLLALAYRAQILGKGKVPAGKLDQKVDALCTNEGITVCTEQGKRCLR